MTQPTAAFVSARVPLVDASTGLITREWYLLFQALFRAGGSTIPDDLIALVAPASNTDAIAAELEDLRSEAALAPAAQPLIFTADDVQAMVSGLQDQIAALANKVDDLQKGVPVL